MMLGILHNNKGLLSFSYSMKWKIGSGQRKLLCVMVRSLDFKYIYWGFPGGAVVENLFANAGDTGSSPGLGRSHMPRSG